MKCTEFIYAIMSQKKTKQHNGPKMDAFAYVQREKPQQDDVNLLSKEELKNHAIRYIKSLKDNASVHLVEQRNGEIELLIDAIWSH